MSGWQLSRRARSDLAEIWRYSNLHWGQEQADRYVYEIYRACGRLAANPSLGRKIPKVQKEIRKYHSGSHVIVHRKRGKQIYVVRILHESMAHERHLP
jgi:toxin ParE1/3/4